MSSVSRSDSPGLGWLTRVAGPFGRPRESTVTCAVPFLPRRYVSYADSTPAWPIESVGW